MPRSIPQHELDAIQTVVAKYPSGVSIEQISSDLEYKLPRRTLQRRLAVLVQDKILSSEGRGRGCRYQLTSIINGDSSNFKNIQRDEALAILKRLKPVLENEFGIKRLALFGSTIRNKAGAESDIDIIVDFKGTATSKRYFGVQFLLEDELKKTVDLVTDKAIRPELRPFIEKEAIDV